MYFAGLLAFFVTVIHVHAMDLDIFDYCKLPCDGPDNAKHIKCERKGCEVDESKCKEFEPVEMTDKLKKLILNQHNKLRNKVAGGKEKQGANGPQPKASNMMALKYNDELASVAQCWANTCQPTIHSKCHRTEDLPWVGQNIGSHSKASKDVYNELESVIKSVINAWYEEVKTFNKDHIKSFEISNGNGEYTLMVWGDIQEIGCGIAKFKDGEMYTVLLVCNYGSTKMAGNILKEEMYKVGKPCTACPEGTKCHSKYKALCGGEGGGKSGGESAGESGGESGDEKGDKSDGEKGGKKGSKKGGKKGDKSGGESGDENGDKSGGEKGDKSDGESGDEKGDKSGAEKGDKSGGESGDEKGDKSGGESGDESGDKSGGKKGGKSGGKKGDKSGGKTTTIDPCEVK